jgi:hypothetical protein
MNIINEYKIVNLEENEVYKVNNTVYTGECTLYLKNGLFHSVNDIPSYKSRTVSKWHKHGALHRDGDLPAEVDENAKCKIWYRNGFIHRDNGPACIYDLHSRSEIWYKNGLIHRDNGPAIKYKDEEQWYLDGVRYM